MFKKVLFLAVMGLFLWSFSYTNAKAADYVLYKSAKFTAYGKQWLARAYQEKNVSTDSNTPAKVCFSNNGGKTNQFCYTAEYTEHDANLDISVTHDLQFISAFDPVTLPFAQNRGGVIFIPKFSGGGSGFLSFLMLWSGDRNGKIVNILPNIEIGELDQFDFTGSDLIVAQGIWGKNEAHFGPHKYEISIYNYSNNSGKYFFATKYTTARKYSNTNVIKAEMPKIKSLM